MQVHRPRIREENQRASVTPLELFFDLVFVFALTQVTAFLADHLTWQGLLRGLLVLVLLWWAWTGYAWLANVASAEDGTIRLVMLFSMSAMFVIALCIPEAYDDGPGGLSGPVVLAVCYLLFRLLHLVIFWLIARDDPGLRRQLRRFAPSVFGGTILLLVAAEFSGPAQTALWVAALAVDYLGTALGGAAGWRLPSPAHFVERHGLILIVALGESIVAIGVGVAERPISVPIVVGSALGLLLAAALWWAYFDLTVLQAEHAMTTEPLETRSRLGRNAFSFGHVPLVAGVVLVALGLKKVLEYVADTEHHTISDPLKGPALAALVGGVIVYLLGHVLFKWLIAHHLSAVRLGTAALLVVFWLLAGHLPALAQLAVVALLVVVALAVETVAFADQRSRIRAEHT